MVRLDDDARPVLLAGCRQPSCCYLQSTNTCTTTYHAAMFYYFPLPSSLYTFSPYTTQMPGLLPLLLHFWVVRCAGY